MAAKAKKSARLGRSKSVGRAAKRKRAAAFEGLVIYRGIKIAPTMAAGKRSSLARAIRDDLRTKSEQSRGKSG